MTTAYAIGDLHGRLDELNRLEDLLAADQARYGGAAQVIQLGDVVDRGPQSRQVIDRLIGHLASDTSWIVLRGNHDRMFAGFLDDPEARDPGLRSVYSYLHPKIGGAATLESYGLHAPADRPVEPVHREALEAVPPAHRAFLAGLKPYHLMGDLLFTHAGIRPNVALEEQTATDLCWIRDPFLTFTEPHPWLVIHGHTVVEAPEHHGNRIGIDTGAAYGHSASLVAFEGREAFLVTAQGRQPILPPHRPS